MNGAPGPRDFDPTAYKHDQKQFLRMQQESKKLDAEYRKAVKKGDQKKIKDLEKRRNKASLVARLFGARLGHHRKN